MLVNRLSAIVLGLVLALDTQLVQAAALPLDKSAIEAALQVAGKADDDAANSAIRDNLPIQGLSRGSEAQRLAPSEPRFAQNEPETITPPPTHSLRVMLDWYINPYHAALIVAAQLDIRRRLDTAAKLRVAGAALRVVARLAHRAAGRPHHAIIVGRSTAAAATGQQRQRQYTGNRFHSPVTFSARCSLRACRPALSGAFATRCPKP